MVCLNAHGHVTASTITAHTRWQLVCCAIVFFARVLKHEHMLLPLYMHSLHCVCLPAAAGGMMGYVKKGSVKSLTSAGGAALILALTARTMSGPGARGAVFVGLAVSLLLTVAMSGRFRRTGKFMPAGLIAGVSLLMSAAYIGSLI